MRGEQNVLAGRYRLAERLGEGGAGTVWRARDETLGRDVAVKQVRVPEGLPAAERATFVDRAIHEARAAARLRDPAIVLVHDVVLEQGHPWIIMDLSTGQSLDKVIKESGPLPPAAVAGIGLRVLSALEVAHAHGILHQDVKPANILLDADGTAMLTDFGIAAPVDGENDLFGTAGSPGYMAPERLNGLPSGAPSDLWSLGASLYTLVEGRPPFQRDLPAAVVAAVLMHEPPFPARAGRELGGLLMEMLAKDPARRPDAAEIRQRLGAPPAPARRRRRWAVPAALGAAALLGLGGWYGVAVLAAPGPETTGRFATAPDPCGLLPDAQVKELLKGEVRRSSPMPGECRWQRSVGSRTLRTLTVTVRAEQPREGRRAPEVATLLFASERASRKAAEGESFKRSTFGVGDVAGVGEAAFAQDTFTDPPGAAGSVVMFRLSNLIGEVGYEVAEERKGAPEARETAVAAARAVSGALVK